MSKIGIVTLTFLCFFVILRGVKAQDKIITNSNDTINCKITRVTGKAIFYAENANSLSSGKRIQRSEIKTWTIHETQAPEPNQIINEYQNGKWRLSIDGGVGYRIASTKESKQNYEAQGLPSNEVDSYFRQIKTGLKASGQIHYMFWEKFGLGIDYQIHHSSGKITGTFNPHDSYTLLYGDLNDDVYTNYGGLSLYYQEWLNPRYKIYYQVSMGVTFFRQENITLYSPSLITGKAFGGNTEVGFEYFLKRNVAVSVNAGFFQSTVSKIKVDNGHRTNEYDLEKEQREGLSRIDLGVGLKFYL
ncbi:hypothetical protein [Maribellus maritimus]|uniref:hypothetical protein n=1 Tax=Maribellus maritimus TaxID=2870838 RepID=UPI001EEB7DC6|nr:hypothetical protein [Maribellus maritimus]MCG6190803.1 hypothetical protein [Maribellus maritimus]